MALDPLTGIDMSGGADSIASQVLAAQWAQWQMTFQPIEEAALQQSSLVNPQVLTDAVNKAKSTAQATYNSMPSMLERRQAGLGVTPTAQQSKVSNRIMNVDKTQAIVGAENQARANIAQEDELLLLGQLPNLKVGGA
jgi:hypothetical protein